MAYDHLSEILAVFVITVGGLGVVERKNAVDNRLKPVHGDSAVHGEKLGATANGNTPQCYDGGGDEVDVDRRFVFGKRPDQADLSINSGRLDRLLKRASASDFDDTINASTIRQLAHRDIPIGRRVVIDHVICPQSLQPFPLLLAPRRPNATPAKHFANLNAYHRNSP